MSGGRNESIDAHVCRLWRHRGTTLPSPSRGPSQQLDLDDILRAGIAVADAHGLEAVSTRVIAAKFGKSAMALYPYVGTKEHFLALMQDHASALPVWRNPDTSLADALLAWARALFEVYLAHPWLTERPWSQATQGPNEQDWLERLLHILDVWGVLGSARPSAVPMVYATVRATAGTSAAYRRMGHGDVSGWLELARATRKQITDFDQRYPLSTGLEPLTREWRDAPAVALDCAVRLIAEALETASG